MYRVIHSFWDMQDKNKTVYNVGDVFPVDGRTISKKRLEELLSNKNKIGKVLIELVTSENDESSNTDDSNLDNNLLD